MNFLRGTYGIDILTLFLIFLSSILNIFGITKLFGLAITLFALYRIFSKNIYKRQNENQYFINKLNNILYRFGKSIPTNIQPIKLEHFSFLFDKLSVTLNEKKNFKITKCPNCGQKLRLPRKKGKIVVTCKKCSNKFDFKT